MKKVCINIDDVIKRITKLKGEKIKMQVNKGRKKVLKYSGVIENVYPSIFTVRLTGDITTTSFFSFAYSEVLCGNVKIDCAN